MQNAKDYSYSSYSEWIGSKDIIDSQCAKLIYGEDEYLDIFLKQHLKKDIVDINEIFQQESYQKF